jgi:hypothetical protein
MTEKIDIADIYEKIFGNNCGAVLPKNYEVSVDDILSKNFDTAEIIDRTKYPLLDKTLRHTLTYLSLRLSLEKALVQKFGIDTTIHKQLGEIINAAFPNDTNIDNIRKRIRLMSKKTLINEFNHFEGNLSIFQPAIDITDTALGRERTEINTFIRDLKT